jgi:hypothetical protein
MSDDEPVKNSASSLMIADEARRLLVAQQATFDGVRTRAIAMLSVASLVAGLFGSRIPEQHSDAAGRAAVVALVCFGLSVVLTLIIVAPRRLRFDHSLARHIASLAAGDELLRRDLAFTWAKGYEADRQDNDDKLQVRMTCLQVVCALVGVQVIAWGLGILL